MSHFYLEEFRICRNFGEICFIAIQTRIFCRFDDICGTWNKLIYALHALHAPFAWAACGATSFVPSSGPDFFLDIAENQKKIGKNIFGSFATISSTAETAVRHTGTAD